MARAARVSAPAFQRFEVLGDLELAARQGDEVEQGTRPTMFYCGNDAAAKAEVVRVLEQFGWEGADMGGAVAARAIEPLAMLWCIPGLLRNSWTHAFHLLK